jgi:hypothetical protein
MKQDFLKSPVGTHHVLALPVNGIVNHMVYKCVAAYGFDKNVPYSGEPLLIMRIAGRYGIGASPYLPIPLSEFLRDSRPLEKDDKFYEFDVQPGEPSEAEIKRSNVR